MAQDIHLVWRGMDSDCAGVRLNGGSVLGGTRVRLELEHVGPRVGAFPLAVETFEVVEPLFARILGHGHRRLDSLRLHPSPHGAVVAVTDTFTAKPPSSPRGQVRILASTDGGTTQAWIDSVDSRGGLRVTNEAPHEYKAKVDVSALEGEASVELGRTAGSTTTYRQHVVAAIDPPVEVEVIRTGEPAFARYLETYLTHKQLWGGVGDPRLELYARYSDYLDLRTRPLVRIVAEPAVGHLRAGELMTVDVQIQALANSARGFFFALRAVNGDTGAVTVSELVRVDRPPQTGAPADRRRVEEVRAREVERAERLR